MIVQKRETMKAKDVLKVLKISRQTLTRYVKQGILKVWRKENGQYEYDDKSVYKFLNRDVERKTVIYARVSTNKQKKDLEKQIELLKQYSFMRGLTIGGIYSDIGSGVAFDNREEFFVMLEEIIAGKISTVVVAYKDRLSRVGFDLFKRLFGQFGCEIVVTSEVGSPKLDTEEIFEEIVTLLHCYAMKMYSARKRKKVLELIETEQ